MSKWRWSGKRSQRDSDLVKNPNLTTLPWRHGEQNLSNLLIFLSNFDSLLVTTHRADYWWFPVTHCWPMK